MKNVLYLPSCHKQIEDSSLLILLGVGIVSTYQPLFLKGVIGFIRFLSDSVIGTSFRELISVHECLGQGGPK